MHSIRSRLSIPVQIFLIIFYIAFILALKQVYDNYQKHQRFENYNNMLQEVSKSLDLVEKHSRRVALNHQQYEGSIYNSLNKVSSNIETQPQQKTTSQPP